MKRKAAKSAFEYGLKPQECAALRDALAASPRVERAVLFGSRATGTFSPASDVDLALYGDGVTLADQADLASRMEDLELPVPVDLLRVATVDSDALRKHIEQHGKLFYQKAATNRASDGKSLGMAREWREKTLTELIDVKHGFAFPGENIRDEPPGDILLTPGNFAIGGGFKGDKFKYFDGVVPEDYVLHDGDLVVTMTDLSKQADTLGYPAIVPKPHGPRFLHNQRLGKILIKDGAELDRGFLFYLLCAAEYRHEVLASSTGTTVKHTSPGRILAHKAAIPPPAEQRAIAHILGTLDDKIDLNRKMNETLEAMARALFQSWFVDFDPVRAKVEGRDPGLPADIAALFPDSFAPSELGEIPKGWSVTNVYEIADVIYGAPFASTHFNSKGIGRPLIRIRDLKDESPEVYTPEIHPKGHTVNQGDIVVGMDGEFRAYIWGGVQAWLNQRVCVFKPKHGSSAAFVVNSIFKPLALVEATETATTVIHLGKSDIDQFKILFPTQDLLEACAKICQPMYDRIVEIKRESRTLASLRDTLLPKLISGELRVKDAAHPVEAAI